MNSFNWMLIKSGFTHSYASLEFIELVVSAGEVGIQQLIEQEIAILDNFDNMVMKEKT